MSRISISQIIARYQAGFGYVAGNLISIAGNRVWGNLVDIPVYNRNDASFADVVFINSKTEKSFGFGNEESIIKPSTGIYQYMAPAPMVSFSRDKNVVRTPIDRSEVEVIEYFGLKPFEISLQGILIDQDEHQYPKDLVTKLNEMFSLSGTFKVVGSLFLNLGVTEVFFESGFEIGFVEGFADTVKFSVKAISAMPVDIKAIGYNS